jgi:hypothetical protein
MPANSKNSTRIELSSLLEELVKANIKFVLVGGLAVVVQGAPSEKRPIPPLNYKKIIERRDRTKCAEGEKEK